MPAPEKPGSPELQDEKSRPYRVEKVSGRASREQPQPTGKAGAAQKVQEKNRPLERAFFTVSSYKDYKEKSEQKIKQGVIARKDLEKASIEELAIGTYMNFNFFHTPISNQVDFIGF